MRFSENGRFLALVAILATSAYARSTGAPPGRTGAPPGDNCTGCHTTSAVNSGSGSLKIEFPSGGSYTPGSTYKVRVTLADPAAQRWGFEVTARMGADKLTKAGNFSIDDATRTQFSPGSTTPGEYVTHTAAGTSPGTTGSSTWEMSWTAPAAGSGQVTFYAAGNAANNSGTNQGDSIYTTSLSIAEATGTVTGKSYILPQLAFGGGWYTAMYFTNTTDTAVQIGLEFYGADGKDLSVPLNGVGPVTDYTATIAPKGTVILEAPNSGSLQQGWAEVTLPAGVTGYGVFRQSVSGRADQEAVVPLSEDSRQMANLTWDDTTLTTAMAVVNPTSNAIAVTMNVFGGDGAQIGTVTLNLAANNRLTFVLREQPGMAGVTGKRGFARLAVPTGSLAVLGLRFAGEAITSIPVSYP